MSAEIQATTALVLLAMVALAVVLWVVWPTQRRIEQARAARRPAELPAPVDVPADIAASPNYWRTDEYLPLHTAATPVEPESEPEVEQSPPAPWWTQPPAVLDQERTPIFTESGAFPELPLHLDPSTVGWNRREVLEQVRRIEAIQAGVEAA